MLAVRPRRRPRRLAAVAMAAFLLASIPGPALAATPVAVDDVPLTPTNPTVPALLVFEDSPSSVWFGAASPTANDLDADGDALTWEVVDPPVHGTFERLTDPGFETWFRYQPDPDFGTLPGSTAGGTWASDSFTYRAFDGTSWSNIATYRIWVAELNDPPTFQGGGDIEVAEDGGAFIGAWASDISPGPALEVERGQTVAFEVETDVPGLFADPPAISANGTLTFTPTPDASGTATMTVVARDDGGTDDYGEVSLPTELRPDDTSEPVTATLTVTPVPEPPADTTDPTISAPVQRLPSQTLGSDRSDTVVASLTWAGQDAGSGIRSYRLEMSVDGGAYRSVPLASSKSTSATRTLDIGRSYRFRVRATDWAGNVSAFKTGPAIRPDRHQETSSLATYRGTWSTARSSSRSGGASRYATSTSRGVTFRFSGRDVAWVATRSTAGGRARVLVDGVQLAIVDLDAGSSQYRRLVFRRHFESKAAHVLEIRPLGDGRIDIDAFVVIR